jgi:hypothetical protein
VAQVHFGRLDPRVAQLRLMHAVYILYSRVVAPASLGAWGQPRDCTLAPPRPSPEGPRRASPVSMIDIVFSVLPP